ncbi:hypothetical protein CDAR_71581 [Caerostris darwini]|uniref:Uncharacterized protein n=1 Tax=Caerostris darwini TaxID=1538125 RepID=A0AAV4M926_9ARAC|nr:hypothetical protein CDAR_71581 [Caerostris darwini]
MTQPPRLTIAVLFGFPGQERIHPPLSLLSFSWIESVPESVFIHECHYALLDIVPSKQNPPFDELTSSLDNRSSVWLSRPRKDSSAIKPIKFPEDRIGSRKCFLPAMPLRFAGCVRRFLFYLPLVSAFRGRYVCFYSQDSSSCIKLPGTLFGLANKNHCLRILAKTSEEMSLLLGY